jgi:hypothetical protein
MLELFHLDSSPVLRKASALYEKEVDRRQALAPLRISQPNLPRSRGFVGALIVTSALPVSARHERSLTPPLPVTTPRLAEQ